MNVYAVRCVYNGRSSTHVLSLLFVLGCIVLRKWRKCFMQRDVDWDNTVFLCNSKRGKEIMAGRKKHMFWSDNGGQMPTKEVGTYVLRTFCVRADMVFCHTNLSCLSQQNAIYRQGSKNWWRCNGINISCVMAKIARTGPDSCQQK